MPNLLLKGVVITILVLWFLYNAMSPSQTPLPQLISSKRLIIIDFDDTITTSDTLSKVIHAAYTAKPDFTPKLSYYTEVYMNAYNTFQNQNHDLISQRYSDIQSEIKYQKLIKQVELSSVNETINTGLFKGVPKFQFHQLISGISSKKGFAQWIPKFIQRKVPIVILSVNWSYIMLSEYMSTMGLPVDNENIYLITNEFEFDSQGICSGKIADPITYPVDAQGISKGIRTGYDKLLITEKLIDHFSSVGKTLYIGDSETDVLSMLRCGCSVSMKRRSHLSFEMLQRMGKKLNIVDGNEWHYVVNDFTEL